MASVLEQLNFFRYSKDTFLNEKEKMEINCSERLQLIINIIESNIKKSGGDNSPFSNSAYGNNRNSYGISKNAKGEKTSSKTKSWRKNKYYTKNLTVIQQKCNEINSLLNKMTSKNYSSITEKIKAYFKDGPEKDDIIDKTITDIFMKAVMQPIYCPDYVKFLNTISTNYDKSAIINNKCVEFRQVIKVSDSEQDQAQEITQKSLSEKEQYDLFCKANKEKKYKEGYAQFIGEMYNKNMISIDTLMNNIDYFVVTLESQSQIDIQDPLVEDILICLCKLFITVNNRETKSRIIPFIDRIIKIKSMPGLQKRLQLSGFNRRI